MRSRTGQIAASLSPLLVLQAALFHIEYFKILAACAFAVAAVQLITSAVFDVKNKFDFSDIIFVLLLSVTVPPKAPFLAVFFAAAAGIFFGKKCFGGLGTTLFHPALLAYALLSLYAPSITSGTLVSLMRFEKLYEGTWPLVIGGIFLITGILMMAQRFIYWEIPLIYLGAVYLCSRFWLGEAYPWAWICLASFFFLSDAETTPSTRDGMRLYAASAALLTLAVSRAMAPGLSAVFSLLIMNSLSAVIDQFVVPSGIRPQMASKNLIESDQYERS